MAKFNINKKSIIIVFILGALIAVGVVFFLPKLKALFYGEEAKDDLPLSEKLLGKDTKSFKPGDKSDLDAQTDQKKDETTSPFSLDDKEKSSLDSENGIQGEKPLQGDKDIMQENFPGKSGYSGQYKYGTQSSDYEHYLNKIQNLKFQIVQLEQELEKKVKQQSYFGNKKIIVLEGNKAKVYDPYYYPGTPSKKTVTPTPKKSSKYKKKYKSPKKKSSSYKKLKQQIKKLKKRIWKLEKRVDELEKE
jgi:hypothetical protein